jgi:hypothetical protein
LERNRSRRAAIAILAIFVFAPAALAGEMSLAAFRDATDGQFDLSDWLLTRKGALPVATIITEPAIGYGAGIGVAFFHQSIGEQASQGAAANQGKMRPPSITAAGGMATENDTWAAGLGHFGSWKGDRIRYIGGAAAFAPKLDYYGEGGNAPAISYELEGWGLIQELSTRLGSSDVFAGVRYVYGDIEGKLDIDGPGLPERDSDVKLGGLAASINWDSRDNILTPTRGVNLVLRGTMFDETFGSDRKFELYDAYAQIYVRPHERLVTGLRIDARASEGDTPFYAKPFLQMRGLPVMRYSDDVAALVEAEVRWNVRGRWSLVGFAGTGRTGDEFGDLGSADAINAYGTGFRYLLARRLGLHAGIDVGFGPDDTAWYIQVGNAWR